MKNKLWESLLSWILVFSMVFPLFSSVISTQAATSGIMDYDAMSMEDIFESEESLTWVITGDSITHNGTWTAGVNGYGEWFEQYLYSQEKRCNDSVVLTGWGGAQTRDFLETSPAAEGTNEDPGMGVRNFITKYNPDVITIKLGMNDRGITTAKFREHYEQMLTDIYRICQEEYSKKPKIILLSPTPLQSENIYDDTYHVNNDAIKESTLRIRNELADIAGEYGLLFCDLRTAFLDAQKELGEDYAHTFFSDASDGLHPNPAGQYCIFKKLCEALGIDEPTNPIFQLTYDDLNLHAMYTDDTNVVDYTGYGNTYTDESTNNWENTVQENYTWAVMGGTQMAGYDGPVVNRSLMRYLENAMRASSGTTSYRDIHMYNLATPGYSVADMVDENKYNTLVDGRNYDVFMLLPEVPELYEGTYSEEDLADFVGTYKANIETLIARNSGKEIVLWTPLASNDATINSYITACAEAVRTIVTENTSIYFFDANKFMNDNVAANASLSNNWFDDGQYISQLGAVDVARAFYNDFNVGGKLGKSELSDHNLRYTSDKNVYKGKYVRDYLPTIATVEGETVSLDVSAITSKYSNTNLKIAILPYKNAGDYNKDIINLKDVATITEMKDGYSFKAPCADLHLAIYGEQDGLIYRFKDISLTVNTDATLQEVTPESLTEVCLDSLEVMSAQDIAFDKDTTTYEVELYSYQTYIRLRATAKAGITIKVKDQVVESNALSEPIKVDDGDTITVTASGTVDGKTETETKTYTLNLTRPEYPDIIITEVMQDAYPNYTVTGSDNYELIEIYNTTDHDLDLLDYSIGYKKDYPYDNVTIADAREYPYYFTGNDQAFSGNATHTGIKELTKYSMYWGDEYTEPDKITFKAHSTMVIWVKYSPQDTASARESYGKALTYDTLLDALTDYAGTHTLTTVLDGEEKIVVPSKDQLVIAEASVDAPAKGLATRAQSAPSNANWYLDYFQANNANNNNPTRGWLFLLKDGETAPATVPENGTITAEGDNIISAAKWVRPGGTDKLSSVFSYNTTRGMSLIKEEGTIDFDKVGTGVTSDVMGYSNLTSFGAIEYWQKPAVSDKTDTKAPVIEDTTSCVVGDYNEDMISVKITDDVDVRYLELYVRKAGETEFTKVATKDFVLEAGVTNAGVSEDITSATFSYSLGKVADDVDYYVTVLDGSGKKASLGTAEEPCKITAEGKDLYYSTDRVRYSTENELPSADGYLFAGWYNKDNAGNYSVVKNPVEGESYYVKYVPKEMLAVKAQTSKNIFLSDGDVTQTDKNAIRFVTSLDSTDYKDVGFDIYIGGNKQDTETNKTNYVYDTLYVIGATEATEGNVYAKNARGVFGNEASKFFKTYTFNKIPQAGFDTDIKARAYYVTYDGTTVYGDWVNRSVNYCRGWFYVGSIAYNNDAANVGTKSNPATLETVVSMPVDTTLVTPKIHVLDDIQIKKEVVVSNSVEIIGVKENAQAKISVATTIADTDFEDDALIKVVDGADVTIENVSIDASAKSGWGAVYVPAGAATKVALKDSAFTTNDKHAVTVGASGNLTMTQDEVTWDATSGTIKSITNCEANTDDVYYLKFTEAWNAAIAKTDATTLTLTNDCTVTSALPAITSGGKDITVDGQGKMYKLTSQYSSSSNYNVFTINLNENHAKVNLNLQNMKIDNNTTRAVVTTSNNGTDKAASPQVNVTNVDLTVTHLNYGVFNFQDNATIFMKDTNVTVNDVDGTNNDKGIIRAGNANFGAVVYARLNNCTLSMASGVSAPMAANLSGNTLKISCQQSTLQTGGEYVFYKEGTMTASVDEFTAANSVKGTTTKLFRDGATFDTVENLDDTSAGASINGFLYVDLKKAFDDAQLVDGYVTVKMLKDSSWATSANVEMITPYVDITIDGLKSDGQGKYKLTNGTKNAGRTAFYIKSDNVSLTVQNVDIHHVSTRAIVNVLMTDASNIDVFLENVDITTEEFDASTVHQYGLFNINNSADLYMKDVTIDYNNSNASFNKDYAVFRFGTSGNEKTVNVELEDCIVNVNAKNAPVFAVPNYSTVKIEAKGCCRFSTNNATLVYRDASNNTTLNWWNTSTWSDTAGTYKSWVNVSTSKEGYSCIKNDKSE